MAHESFEHEGVAALVNELTVPIKVDREERPDVDAVYMTATQAMTGQGGWPMTVFATPEGEPFYCGTYFPRDAFERLVTAVSDAWKHQREAVLEQSGKVVDAIRQVAAKPPANPMHEGVLDAAVQSLMKAYDKEHGGFGGAPKFPPHMNLLFLLRHYQRTRDDEVLAAVRFTCERMARGGMYDQLAGGFARYAVDGTWTVPHFEKMLYDNALLLRVYVQLDRIAGGGTARRVAGEVADFLRRDLHDGHGFISALDADTDGVEGLTYVWTPAQLDEVLGEIDGTWARYLLEVAADGTFEHGTSVLQLPEDPLNLERWLDIKRRLKDARDQRPQPARDGKIVAAWNGLAITALIEFGQVYGDQRAVQLAVDTAGYLRDVHLVDGRLRRVSRDGVVGAPAGVLEDYGAVAEAFCAVHQATGDGAWLTEAKTLLDVALERFADPDGGFFDTADDAERLVSRPADVTDNATPSGLSTIAAALVTYSALTGDPKYREVAEKALATVAMIAATHGRFTGYACSVGEALLSGPYEIAIATEDRHDPLVTAAWWHAPPGAVVVAGPPDAPGVPLLEHRIQRDGQPTAYICRNFVCDSPVTALEDLVSGLG